MIWRKDLRVITRFANSDNYEVYLSDVSKQKGVVSFAKSLEGVRKVNKSDVVAKTLTSVNKLVGYVSVAIIAILLAVSVFLISNTVTMGITVDVKKNCDHEVYRCKRRIRPCSVCNRGLIIGAVGAVIPLVLLYFMYDKAITYIMTKFSLLNNIVDFLPVANVYRNIASNRNRIRCGNWFCWKFLYNPQAFESIMLLIRKGTTYDK